MDKFKKLQLDLLDKKFIKFKEINLPKKGWINTVRTSLSMTLEQLAKRLGVSTSAVSQFEQSEIQENISLQTLQKVANAMNCKLSYVFIPNNKSFHSIIKDQARKKAKEMVKDVNDSMALENHKVKNNTDSVKSLTKELLKDYNSKIWSDD